MILEPRQTKQEHKNDLGMILSCFSVMKLVRRRTLWHSAAK